MQWLYLNADIPDPDAINDVPIGRRVHRLLQNVQTVVNPRSPIEFALVVGSIKAVQSFYPEKADLRLTSHHMA